MAKPALRVVDVATGEVSECAGCAELQDQLAGAEKELRAWRRRYAELRRDSERDARIHPQYAEAQALFVYWRHACKHPRSHFTAERFWMCEPMLREHGLELCKRAIDGAAFDPYTTSRRNGSRQRHDGFDLIFRNQSKFEEMVNRAPRADRNAL